MHPPQPAAPLVQPVTHPNHDGTAAEGDRALPGPLPSTIGDIVSVSSTLTLADAALPIEVPPERPPWSGKAIVGAGATVGFLIGWSSIALLGGLVLAAAGAAVGYFVAKTVAPELKSKHLGECWCLGSEGFATMTRTNKEVRSNVVRFGNVRSFDISQKHTTVTRMKDNSQFSYNSYEARFVGHNGRDLCRLAGSPPKDGHTGKGDGGVLGRHDEKEHKKHSFVNAAEAAYMKFKLPVVLADLKAGKPVRFFMDFASDFIDLSSQGMTIALRGSQAALPFSDIQGITIQQGGVSMLSASVGPIGFKLGELHDAKLFLALMQTQGVRVG